MNNKYLFAIYTCIKNQQKAEFLYHTLYQRLPNNVDIRLFVGKGNILSQCPYVTLQCDDDYDSLSYKTQTLIEYAKTHEYAGLLKCDDDIFPNLQILCEFFANPDKGDYVGNIANSDMRKSRSHINKSHKIKKPIIVPKCVYCTGPIYYLSKNAMKIPLTTYHYYEDVMVGLNMANQNIAPKQHSLYTTNVFGINKQCVENVNDSKKHIFTYLQGGLGNQLFQIAAAYGTALLRGMLPVGILSTNPAVYVHNEKGIDTYLTNIFRNFVCLKGAQFGRINVWKEDHTTGANCFKYCNQKQMQFDTNSDLLMTGYFQTEKYFLHVKDDLLNKIIDTGFLGKIQQQYANAADSYFIHVRRGDYVGHPLYAIDYDTYLKNAMTHIQSKDAGPKHYYVLSNDPDYCKSHSLFANKDDVMFTVLDAMPTLDTLYLMAACAKGGICANSSFSWWGSYMNRNPDKIVCFPDVWMTNISRSEKLDIYYEGSVVIPSV